MVEVTLAAEVRSGGRLEVYVDSFEIERRMVGEPLFDEERQMAAELSGRGIVNHVGQEISYAAHLNAYGPDVPLADLGVHPHGLTPRAAVELAHAHGGLVSLNHFFGIETKMMSHRFPATRRSFEAGLSRLIANRAYGVDLLEVGYRERGHGLDAFSELWDRLANAGIRLTGIGTSDSHNNDEGWQQGPNNFITWVYAASSSQVDLLDGLRAGRAFFGDPTRFDGELDISTPEGGRMGQVLVVAPGRQRLSFRAEGLRPGQRLRLVRDGDALRTVLPAPGQMTIEESIDVGGPTFVRFEVREEAGAVAFSNPLYFVSETDASEIPAARRR